MRSISQILSKTRYSENQMELFMTDCYVDFLYFAEHVLGYEIAEYHKEWLHLIESFTRVGILSFRGSGKTAFMSGYYIWKAIFRMQNYNVLILSYNFEQSKLVLKLIRRLLQENELLRSYIPEGKEATWKATELSLKTEATFYCKTYGEGVRGLRIDDLLCDEAGQYEDKSIFWTAVSPVVQLNKGRICVIGTRKSEIDLLSELEDNKEYMCNEYPAETQDGKAMWSQKYTMLDHDTVTQRSLICVKREIGELAYQQEMMLIPISTANSLFPTELTSKALSKIDKYLPFGKIGERYYVGYDIALSPKGDWTVIVVIAENASVKRIVKSYRFRRDTNYQLEIIRKVQKDFKPIKIVVDATGIGEDQALRLIKEFSNIEAVRITYDEKYKMLLDLRREFETFNLLIPNNIEDESYAFAQQLITELREFSLKIDTRAGQTVRPKFHSGKYDDCVMALALANKGTISPFGPVSLSVLEVEDD